MDDKLSRIKQLIELKEQTDAELFALIGGGDFQPASQRKPQECSLCKAAGRDGTGHTSRTCPHKGAANGQTQTLSPIQN